MLIQALNGYWPNKNKEELNFNNEEHLRYSVQLFFIKFRVGTNYKFQSCHNQKDRTEPVKDEWTFDLKFLIH